MRSVPSGLVDSRRVVLSYRKRSLSDTRRPQRVTSLTMPCGALTWWTLNSLAIRGYKMSKNNASKHAENNIREDPRDKPGTSKKRTYAQAQGSKRRKESSEDRKVLATSLPGTTEKIMRTHEEKRIKETQTDRRAKKNPPPPLPAIGKPGGLDDPLRRGLTGSEIRRYLCFLSQGIKPEEARKKVEDKRLEGVSMIKKTRPPLPSWSEPGGLGDPLRHGLSGAGVRWYLRFLAQGLKPEEARKRADAKRVLPPGRRKGRGILPMRYGCH